MTIDGYNGRNSLSGNAKQPKQLNNSLKDEGAQPKYHLQLKFPLLEFFRNNIAFFSFSTFLQFAHTNSDHNLSLTNKKLLMMKDHGKYFWCTRITGSCDTRIFEFTGNIWIYCTCCGTVVTIFAIFTLQENIWIFCCGIVHNICILSIPSFWDKVYAANTAS